MYVNRTSGLTGILARTSGVAGAQPPFRWFPVHNVLYLGRLTATREPDAT